jgi:site-specific DNA recombinase
LCREFAIRHFPGAEVVETYSDEAASGASLDRPGVQSMLRAARRKEFDLVLFESLNRLSRDMADAASVKKEFDFQGIELWAVHGGKLDTMRTGLESLMGQMFREETAQKVMRGMRPRAAEGFHMGGRPYGYRPLVEETRNIDDKGRLMIIEAEGKIILRIFVEYVSGMKPRMIAAGLNRDGIPSPRGGKWNASTINGQRGRGVGILHNELYVGRYRWNKQTFKKPPGTNKRVSRINQPNTHTVIDVPEYRIVPQDLWDKAHGMISGNAAVHPSKQRTPPRLLSQLIRCPACGAGWGRSAKIRRERFGLLVQPIGKAGPVPTRTSSTSNGSRRPFWKR